MQRCTPANDTKRECHTAAQAMDIPFLALPLNIDVSPFPMPAPFQSKDHSRLYHFFATSVLPCMVRQTSLARYSEQRYCLWLALEHPSVMGAMIGIAALRAKEQSPRFKILAIESYLFSINCLRSVIANAEYTGNEDWLLATTIFLCVLEVMIPLLSVQQAAKHWIY